MPIVSPRRATHRGTGLEAASLVGAEAVLPGEDHGEGPAVAGWASESFGTRIVMKREIGLPLMVTVPSVVPEASW